MKNDKNSHPVTPSGTTAQPQQTVQDNHQQKAVQRHKHLKKFTVELSFTQYSYAKVIIEAASQEDAEEMADELDSDQIDSLDVTDGELSVLSVTPLKGGKAND